MTVAGSGLSVGGGLEGPSLGYVTGGLQEGIPYNSCYRMGERRYGGIAASSKSLVVCLAV
jgi:hypothetical protein